MRSLVVHSEFGSKSWQSWVRAKKNVDRIALNYSRLGCFECLRLAYVAMLVFNGC